MSLDKEKEIEIRGCNPIKEIIIPDDKIISLIEQAKNIPEVEHIYSIHRMKLEDILFDGQSFINEHFRLHKIPYEKTYRLLFNKLYYYKIKNIHPYKLPLGFIKEEGSNGAVIEYFIPDEPRPLFVSLNIGEVLCEISSPAYVHEITHTQLDSLKGSIKDYYNQEVLSIFLQLVHSIKLSSDERILRLQEANRIYELDELTKQQIEFATGRLKLSEIDQIENSKYIQSDLIALNLFYVYYYNNEQIKKEMLKGIQRIFDGEITVEDYLEHYEINLSNSKEEKRLIKYLNRK